MLKTTTAVAIATALMMSACAYPTSTTTQGGISSGLSFTSLPGDALVAVDGTVVGTAASYSGAKILAVTPGTHKVTVQHGGRTLVDRDYYVARDGAVKVEAQ